jgi:hypothetical protein
MGQVYAEHDIALRENAFLELRVPKNVDSFERDSFESEVEHKDHEEVEIKFQFPPRILSDNRKGAWKEGGLRGMEPVAVFKTSGPREISLTWTYIVTDNDTGSLARGFSTVIIAEQVKLVRGYFAAVRARKEGARNLIAVFRYGLFGGTRAITARIKSIDVKHGDTIIVPNGDASKAFPLRTDITVDLRLWTKGAPTEDIQDVKGLQDFATPDWF